MPQRGSGLREAPTFELVIPTAMTLLSPDCINVPAGALCAPLNILRWVELVTCIKLFFFRASTLGERQGVGKMIPVMPKDVGCCCTVAHITFRRKDFFSHAETSRVAFSDTVEVKKGYEKKVDPWELHAFREPPLYQDASQQFSYTESVCALHCNIDT